MTDAQKRFCDEYLISLNATQAYKIAYPNCKKDETASAASSRLLSNVKVQEYITKEQEDRKKKVEITQQMVLEELAKIGFSDIRNLYNEYGALKNIKDIDNDTAKAISGIETFQEFDGRGDDREYIGDTKKVKMLDKTKALELLGRHLGMFKDKVEVSGSVKLEDFM